MRDPENTNLTFFKLNFKFKTSVTFDHVGKMAPNSNSTHRATAVKASSTSTGAEEGAAAEDTPRVTTIPEARNRAFRPTTRGAPPTGRNGTTTSPRATTEARAASKAKAS